MLGFPNRVQEPTRAMAALKETKWTPNQGAESRERIQGERVSISTASAKACRTDGSHKVCAPVLVCVCEGGCCIYACISARTCTRELTHK